MRIAICEDEIRECQLLKKMIEASGREITLYSDAQSFFKDWEKGIRFELVFTDIAMENESAGMDLCGKLSKYENGKRVFLVIVTNYIEYAPEGYRNGVFRYLLKPLKQDAVDQVLEDVVNAGEFFTETLQHREAARYGDIQKHGKLIVEAFDGEHIIDSRDILYMEVHGRYLDVHVQKGREAVTVITLMQSMKEFACRIPRSGFTRVNRNQMVNLQRIATVKQGRVALDSGVTLSVSRRQQRELQEALARCLA